jgi:hypothetical protein
VSHCVVFLIYSSHSTGIESTGTPGFASLLFPSIPRLLSNRLVVVAAVISNDAELLSSEVDAKGNGSYSEAGEGALEALEAGEGTCVPPLLTVNA